MEKPILGGRYKLSDGTVGRIMSVSLVEDGCRLGHTSFREWFSRYTKYEILVAYETANGNITSERIFIK